VTVLVGQVEHAIAELRAGRAVVLLDDATGGGDLIFAAELATPELMAYMVRHTCGFVCVSLPEDEADRLDLPAMHRRHHDRLGPVYAVTVDARSSGTGISAADRANTVRLLADEATDVDALTRPGHIVPIRVRASGNRWGRAEAAHELVAASGLRPAGVLASLVSTVDPTAMAGSSELCDFASMQGLAIVSVTDVRDHSPAWSAGGELAG
jgi:3,4-dihydroxy 2-butanone 4-phosphate synthase/GTP cyclohydrolase II